MVEPMVAMMDAKMAASWAELMVVMTAASWDRMLAALMAD